MKTKNIIFSITLIMAIASSAYTQQADPESDFEARPTDGGRGIEITGYVGNKQEVRIPATIQGIPVTHIGDATYSDGRYSGSFAEKDLISVTIPNSVTEIDFFAFHDNQLTSITIGANVVLGWDSFNNVNSNSGFEDAYKSTGRVAGTYTRPNTDSTTWTRR
jgi:hypothetical protein